MRSVLGLSVAFLLLVPGISGVALAKRDAADPRKVCREAIQKANGLGKDSKVSRKEIDRCVANGGRPS